MTALALKKNILNILETRLYVIHFRFVRAGILQSSVRPQQSTTDKRRWAIMQRRNCTAECRQT